jgi:Domain of unknown function (DUF222)
MSIASQPVPAPSHPFADLDRLGDEMAELSAHLDAATARLLTLIHEFDARGGWNSGFSSCAAWLGWRVGLDLGAARERVRVARALGSLPRLAEALACGELSYAKVRALTRVATPATEARLLAVGRAGTAAHIERIVRGWRRVGRQADPRGWRPADPGARCRPRDAVPADARHVRHGGIGSRDRAAHPGAAAGRRAGPAGGDRAAPRDRPWRPG